MLTHAPPRFGGTVHFGLLGTAMVGIAAFRFVRTAKNIDQKELRPGTGSRIDIALAGLLVLLGCALFFFYIRAYWPEKAILDGTWQPPKIEKAK